MLTINIDIARRFILGRQGLWPGRHWRGIEGATPAMRAMEFRYTISHIDGLLKTDVRQANCTREAMKWKQQYMTS